jgi:hypothetical protein
LLQFRPPLSSSNIPNTTPTAATATAVYTGLPANNNTSTTTNSANNNNNMFMMNASGVSGGGNQPINGVSVGGNG